MKAKVITNAVQAEMPEGLKAEVGKPLVINLAPPGEYPQTVDDPEADGGSREVNQILDEQAIDTLIANFKDKVLVDADHSSETSTNTKAMAWVTRLFKDPEKGLMAEIEPTPIGAENINGRVYRFVSGAWTLDDDGRPVKLVSIGLTNKPNLPVAPMLNSAAAEKKDSSGTEPATADGGVTKDDPIATPTNADEVDENGKKQGEVTPPSDESHNNSTEVADEATKEEGTLNMDIRAKLNLAPEATDEEVEQALDALIANAEGMGEVKNALNSPDATNEETVDGIKEIVNVYRNALAEKEEAQKAQLNAEAEQLVAENEDVIPEDETEAVKKQYVEDPEAAKATVANFRKVYEKAVLNCTKTAAVAKKAEHVVVKNASAKQPKVALNMADALAAANGDPEKENAILLQMARGH